MQISAQFVCHNVLIGRLILLVKMVIMVRKNLRVVQIFGGQMYK